MSVRGDPNTYHVKDVLNMTNQYNATFPTADNHSANFTYANTDMDSTIDELTENLSRSTLQELAAFAQLGDPLCEHALATSHLNTLME